MRNLRTRLGEIVKARREAMGLSQGDLAKKIGVSVPTIVSVEKARRPTDIDTLERITRYFGLAAHELAVGGPQPAAADHPLTECVRRVGEAALGAAERPLQGASDPSEIPKRAPTQDEADWVLGSILATPGGHGALQSLLNAWAEKHKAKRTSS